MHKRDVQYILKGMNNKTEMYSALKAEVVDPDDHTTCINMSIINQLKEHERVFISGQAKSHCVNETVRDLMSYWKCGRPTKGTVIVLEDTTSPVETFEWMANEFVKDMKAEDVKFLKTIEIERF